MSPSGKILIIEDEQRLRMNLRAFLEDLDFEVFEAANGHDGLATCARENPDLILLDVSMPGMDGFEVCERLKASQTCRDKPIIFISALLEGSEKVKAFQSGGADYITKPFQFDEVEARVKAHLERHSQRLRLKEQNEALQRLEKMRDSLTHMIAHDMRSPLTVIQASIEMIDLKRDGRLPELCPALKRAKQNTQRLADMITQMLDISRLESGQMPLDKKSSDLVIMASEAKENAAPLHENARIQIHASGPVHAPCDQEIIGRVLTNLLGNALKFIPKDGCVDIHISTDGAFANVRVLDNGPGIPEPLQAHVFEKFCQGQEDARKKGAGLGLTFCKLAVEAHQGEIGVKKVAQKRIGKKQADPENTGCEFWFKLPTG